MPVCADWLGWGWAGSLARWACLGCLWRSYCSGRAAHMTVARCTLKRIIHGAGARAAEAEAETDGREGEARRDRLAGWQSSLGSGAADMRQRMCCVAVRCVGNMACRSPWLADRRVDGRLWR